MKLIYTDTYGTITEERARDLGLLQEGSPMQNLSQANRQLKQELEEEAEGGFNETITGHQTAFIDEPVSVVAEENEDDFETQPGLAITSISCLSDPRHNAGFSRQDKAARYVQLMINSGVKPEDISAEQDGVELDIVEDLGVKLKESISKDWVYDVSRPGLRKHVICEASARIGHPCPVCGLYEGQVVKKVSSVGIKKEILAIIKEEMTEWPRSKQADESVVDELLMYAENDDEIYERRFVPILKNLKRKVAKGVYNPKLAAKLWTYAADDAARKYEKEFGMPSHSISVATRKLVGIELEASHREEIMLDAKMGQEEDRIAKKHGTTVKHLNKQLKKNGPSDTDELFQEQMGTGGRNPEFKGNKSGKFGPLGLSMDPPGNEMDTEADLADLEDPAEWELASMGLNRRRGKEASKNPLRFSPIKGDEKPGYNDKLEMNEAEFDWEEIKRSLDNPVREPDCKTGSCGKLGCPRCSSKGKETKRGTLNCPSCKSTLRPSKAGLLVCAECGKKWKASKQNCDMGGPKGSGEHMYLTDTDMPSRHICTVCGYGTNMLPSELKEEPLNPGDEIVFKSIVKEEEDDSQFDVFEEEQDEGCHGMEETGQEYWKDPSYVAEKVAEATSLVTNDDPNAVHKMYGIVREYRKDIEIAEAHGDEDELYEELAEYFISMMTDESDDYQAVAMEPDDEETGRSALEGAGMFRSEAYTFRKMDQVELGKAILKHFER